MSRLLSTFAVLLVLSAWVGAQGPIGLTAADQIRLLRMNRTLLEELIDDGVDLAGASAPLDRADKCQNTARSLAIAMERAVRDQDADRVAELGGHLEAMLRDGLAPTLAEAKGMIPDGSPDAARLKAVGSKAISDLDMAHEAIPANGKVGDNKRVKELRGKLEALKDQLK